MSLGAISKPIGAKDKDPLSFVEMFFAVFVPVSGPNPVKRPALLFKNLLTQTVPIPNVLIRVLGRPIALYAEEKLVIMLRMFYPDINEGECLLGPFL